jgi:hypothetical protein
MPTLAKNRPVQTKDDLDAAVAERAASTAPKRRPRDEDDDADIETSRSRRSAAADDGDDGDVATGWGGADEVAVPSGFATNLKLEKGETAVFKFLDDAPYANLKVHWIERKGKRSFICTQKKDCPLCALGDLAETQSEHRFNIALFTDAEPVLRSMNVSYGHAQEFKEYHTGPGGPLTKRIYTRTRPKGPGGRYKHSFFRHAEDVLEEHPKLHVPTQAELDALVEEGLFTQSTARKERSSMEELEKIAAELSGDSDYADD